MGRRQPGVSDLPLIKKMTSPASLKEKGKQKVTDGDVLTFGDLEDATDSGSSSGTSSDSGSDGNSDSDSDSVSGSGSSSSPESEPGAKPEAGAKEDAPLSRDDLLAYLENMRRRFSTKPTTDSFADQEEEVLIVTSKKKQGLTQLLNALRLICIFQGFTKTESWKTARILLYFRNRQEWQSDPRSRR